MPTLQEQETIDIIHEYAPRARTLHALDKLATIARDESVWSYCQDIIHERNLRLLGKDGKQAIYINKDGVTFSVWDGWTQRQGNRVFHVHARGLCENGFRYVRQGNTWKEVE